MIWSEDGERFELVDKKSKIRAELRVEKVPQGTLLNLAPVEIEDEMAKFKTFQAWSQDQKQKMQEKPKPIPGKFKQLVEKYPEIQKFDFKKMEMKHGVTHTIDTASNAPCRAKVRHLVPGSPKAIQGEKKLARVGNFRHCGEMQPGEV